jgi:hypothetical protein
MNSLAEIIKNAIKECDREMKRYGDPETGDGHEYEYENGKKAAYKFVLAEMKNHNP